VYHLLIIQKFLDGGIHAVVEAAFFELSLTMYALVCFFDLPPVSGTSFYVKLTIMIMLTCLSHSSLFFSFGNRNMVYSFLSSHETGKAMYVNTGRPTPYERKALHQLYYAFAQSHYQPAVALLSVSALIMLLSRDTTTFVRLIVFVVPVVLWVVAPVVFMPNASTVTDSFVFRFLVITDRAGEDIVLNSKDGCKRIFKDEATFYKSDGSKEVDLSFADFWALKEYESFVESGPALKLLKATMRTYGVLLLWLVTPGMVKAQLVYFMIAWVVYAWATLAMFCLPAMFLNLFQFTGLPICYGLVLYTSNFSFLAPFDELTRMLWCVLLQLMIMQVAYDLALLLAHCIAAPRRAVLEGDFEMQKAKKTTLEKEALKSLQDFKLLELFIVQLLHWLFMLQPVQWLSAFLVLTCQQILLRALGVLDEIGGMHAWYLFNQRGEHKTAETSEGKCSYTSWKPPPLQIEKKEPDTSTTSTTTATSPASPAPRRRLTVSPPRFRPEKVQNIT